MSNYTFRTIIEPDEGGTFHGYVPALSGCHTWGESIKETQENLKEAIALYIESLIDSGEEVPTEMGFESFQTITEKELVFA